MSHTFLSANILTLLFALSWPVWPDSSFIPGSSCTLYYNTTNPSANTTFTFINCTINTHIVYSTWPDCYTNCCPSMPAGDYSQVSQQIIATCKEYNGATIPSSVIVLVITMVLVLFGLVILTCFCVLICRLCRMMMKNSKIRN
jgi:hypothetical protein